MPENPSLIEILFLFLVLLGVILLLTRQKRLAEASEVPGSINLQILPPFLIVKCAAEKGPDDYYTFEVWSVPEDPQALFERAATCSTLLHTFAGEFMEARSKCRAWLDDHYLDAVTIWADRSDPLYAGGRSV